MDERLKKIVHDIVQSGFSKKVIAESIEKAERYGADDEFMSMIRNCLPMGE